MDLSRPARPTAAGRWWLPGTQDGDGAPAPARHRRLDAGFRVHNINLHAQRPHRAYLGYLDAGAIILIRDPFQPGQVAAFEPDGAVQINDVYVTADGIVYAADRNGGGLYILEYSGPG